MADGPALALQKGLIDALKADAGVAALVGTRVYDEPPKGATHPYVRLGNMDIAPMRTDGCTSWSALFSVEAHSRPLQGRVEATRIAQAAIAALNEREADVTAAGFTVAWLFFVTAATVRAADGESYQANIAFEALLDPAP